MAPPKHPQQPTTLTRLWALSHLITLITTLVYALLHTFTSYITLQKYTFAMGMACAAVGCGIVVFTKEKPAPTMIYLKGLLQQNDFYYIALAAYFAVTRHNYLAVITPYAVFALFHLATFTSVYLLPQMKANPGTAKQSEQLASTLAQLEARKPVITKKIPQLELFTYFTIIGFTLFGRGYLLDMLVYHLFINARTRLSPEFSEMYAGIAQQVKKGIDSPRCPNVVRNTFNKVASFAAKAQAPPVAKAQ